MALAYEVPEYKRVRVNVDTDADCEADDPYAIAHALMSPKFEIKAIFAEQFGDPDTTQKSYTEILTILKAMQRTVPAFMGEEGTFQLLEGKEISPAAKFLIEEALRPDEKPLFILCLGAITNIAAAIRANPEIISRLTVVWIGGQSYESFSPTMREFNAGNDIEAINFVISSGVAFWQVPQNVYGSMRIGLAELQKKVYPCGEIGKHLFEKMVAYNESPQASWTAGESWSLGDSPAVGVVLDPHCGMYHYCEAPIFNEDTTYRFEAGRPFIRVYQTVSSRFVLDDFLSKLALLYGTP